MVGAAFSTIGVACTLDHGSVILFGDPASRVFKSAFSQEYAMSQFSLPLPNRTIGLAKRPFAFQPAFIFSILVFLALAIGLAWWQGPGLLRDWRISQNPIIVEDWDILAGECSSRRGLTDCEADVVYNYGGQDYEKHIALAFFDLSSSDYMVELVIDADDPDLATLSLGLDMLWNRTITFAVFMLLFGGGVIVIIVTALQTMAANRAAANPGRLSVVPVEITEVRDVRGRSMITYVEQVSARKKRTMRTGFEKGQGPLVGVDENGVPMGLAVRFDHMTMPVLLDTGLQRIEMMDSERRSALEAFEAEQAQRGGVAIEAASVKAKGQNPVLRGLRAAVGVLLLAVIAFFGYWIYYVTSAPDAFDSIGIEINNIMPEPLNSWGCEQLYQRFGKERAPYGCVSSEDWVSWRVAPEQSKVK